MLGSLSGVQSLSFAIGAENVLPFLSHLMLKNDCRFTKTGWLGAKQQTGKAEGKEDAAGPLIFNNSYAFLTNQKDIDWMKKTWGYVIPEHAIWWFGTRSRR